MSRCSCRFCVSLAFSPNFTAVEPSTWRDHEFQQPFALLACPPHHECHRTFGFGAAPIQEPSREPCTISSGAAVPNAQVAVRNDATAQILELKVNEQGTYVFRLCGRANTPLQSRRKDSRKSPSGSNSMSRNALLLTLT